MIIVRSLKEVEKKRCLTLSSPHTQHTQIVQNKHEIEIIIGQLQIHTIAKQ